MAYEVDPELPGAFDPDGIAQRDFAVVRRGFDPAAVRAFLAAVADEQAELRRRGHGAELQVADLLGRLDDAEALREEADARAAVLERELADVRAEDALRAAADEAELARYHDALEAARREVAALERRLASQDAAVPEALAALVADALPAADAASVGEETARVLAAAHEAAEAIRTRALADGGRVEAAARELAQRVVLDAEAEAAAVLEAAHREATEMVAEAVAEAQTQAERGAAAAEALVADASGARRALLEELTARRRRLRHQVEQLQAARDRLLEVLDAAGTTLAEVRAGVDDALPAARAAAAEVDEPDAAEVAAEVAAATASRTVADDAPDVMPVPGPGDPTEPSADRAEPSADPAEPSDDPAEPSADRAEPSADPDIRLFDRLRDQAGDGRTDGPRRQVTRRLKKALTDEENALLDRVCRGRRLPAPIEALPDAPARREVLAEAAAPLGPTAAALVADRLADPLGARVEAALTAASDPDDAARKLRAVYREWRDERVTAAMRAVPSPSSPQAETRRR